MMCHILARPLLTMHSELWGPPPVWHWQTGFEASESGQTAWETLYSLPTHMHSKDWQLEGLRGTSIPGEGISALMWAVAMR